ncbi:uncharacterized protein LOC132042262 [Lycium ferocissimum]|uniref:uncharacterized protein LOC132042262 n=1 Tax=Lycium ferocissimum TaxID=112874 RepID=UPI0028163B5D|nr:uncharacterized protein LOC132042262 [Lycium ferocissimum]
MTADVVHDTIPNNSDKEKTAQDQGGAKNQMKRIENGSENPINVVTDLENQPLNQEESDLLSKEREENESVSLKDPEQPLITGEENNEKEMPPDEWAEGDSTEENTSDESSDESLEEEEESQHVITSKKKKEATDNKGDHGMDKDPDFIPSLNQQSSKHGCAVNNSNKIWIFWSADLICEVYANDDQMLTCKIHNASNNSFIYLSVVYAKSRSRAREQLWDHMRAFASTISNPWMVCGDFNSILGPEEKLGGTAYKLSKSLNFIECLTDCGLVDMGYSGNAFTWCNERKMEDIIWKRLDRMVANDEMGSMFSSISVQHLAREDFQDIVNEQWNKTIDGNIFWSIQQKMKRVSKAISEWSRNKIGDIFFKANQLEDSVSQCEEKYMNTLDQTDRMLLNKAKADLVLHHKKVDAYWRQKAHLEWQLEGDENTKFFHSVVRGRRHHMRIQRIKCGEEWLEEEENIAKAAIDFYRNLFSQNHTYIDLSILDCIPNLVTCEDNQMLKEEISSKEVKDAIFDIDPNSSAGPDGFSSLFFQKCWSIVEQDLVSMVKAVYNGTPMPKYFTSTCLILIPKSQHPQEFSEFRPISLSNVTHKIVSKVLNNRLSKILPKIISFNQSGFMKGRAIGENVLLAQEIVHDIRKPNKGGNVVIKLDMSKAYDKISWNFICAVMRRMGFNEHWIFIIWNLMSNAWFGHQETQEHLFHDSMISKNVWKHFHQIFGIKEGGGSIRQRLLSWWLTKEKNPVQQMVLQIIPSIILWQIWKERCKSRFEDIKMSKTRVISNTCQQTILLVHKQFNTINPFIHWSNLMEIIEHAHPLFKTVAVKWNVPRPEILKLNSDGCSKGNPGPSGGGGLIRDQREILLSPMLCLLVILLTIWLSGSTGKSKPPWTLLDMVELIQRNLESIQDKSLHHIYRECNKPADSLANWGLSRRHTIWMNNFQELPRETRGELKVDKMQIPSFRNSIVKNSLCMYRSMYRNFLFDVP